MNRPREWLDCVGELTVIVRYAVVVATQLQPPRAIRAAFCCREVMVGRPSLYSRAIAEAICARLADGETLRAICRDPDMPPERTVRDWIVDNREGFSRLYARAREAQAHRMADELLEISDDGSNDWMEREGKAVLDAEHVQRSRLRADTRKWLLSKMLPKVYGEKLAHTGPDGGAVTFSVITGVPRPDDTGQ